MRTPSGSEGSAPQFAASQPHLQTPRASRRAFRQLRSRRNVLPVLVAAVLLAGLVVTLAGYFGARGQAIENAKAGTAIGVRTDEQMLLTQGGPLVAVGTTLAIGPSSAPVFLNNNTISVELLHKQSGQNVTIYALDGSQLTAIATDIPNAQGQTALNMHLTGAAYDALLGQCGPSDTASQCHHTYSGQATLAGTDYITSVTPLFDGNGNFAGAVGTAIPLSTVEAPARTFAIVLAIISALLAAVALAGGLLYFAPLTSALLDKLDLELTDVAGYAADVEHLSRSQVARAQRQERMARQTHEVTRQLDVVLDALEQGQEALRDSTSEIWAGMSQPGAGLAAQDATRLARQAAITAGRIGAATEDARDRCRSLVSLMNQVIAEGRVINQNGHEVESRAGALRQSIEQVEMTLGAQVVARQYDLPGQPFARRVSGASRRLFQRGAPVPPSQPLAQPQGNGASKVPARVPATPRMFPQTGPLAAQQFLDLSNPHLPAFGGAAGMSSPGLRSVRPARPAGGAISRPLGQPQPWPASNPPSSPDYGPASLPGPASHPNLGNSGISGIASASGVRPNPLANPLMAPHPVSLSQPHGFVPWLRTDGNQPPQSRRTPAPNNDWMIGKRMPQPPAAPNMPSHPEFGAPGSVPPRQPPNSEWVND